MFNNIKKNFDKFDRFAVFNINRQQPACRPTAVASNIWARILFSPTTLLCKCIFDIATTVAAVTIVHTIWVGLVAFVCALHIYIPHEEKRNLYRTQKAYTSPNRETSHASGTFFHCYQRFLLLLLMDLLLALPLLDSTVTECGKLEYSKLKGM